MLLLMLLFAIAPHRIVSVAPAITEILFALGAGDQVVGDTTYCNYPEAAKAIWDFEGIYCSSRHIPHVRFPGVSYLTAELRMIRC